MVFIVGLTGGIGCGKTSTSELFSNLGITVIDTDVIARELTQSGGLAISTIQNSFGNRFVTSDGALDRNKMRNLIFSDYAARLKLEKILHPLILKETISRIKKISSPYAIVVIPLLFETCDYENIIQRVLVVDCDEQLQLSRTIARTNLSAEKVKAIIATQISREVRLQKADDIIINNYDINHLKQQVLDRHNQYLLLSNM
ncbi:MAG: dephospho-CoA kinase [Nitrosomonas sp.]|nr:MAG: dephospho-CoA kinase [Nitrosomonas sp.]